LSLSAAEVVLNEFPGRPEAWALKNDLGKYGLLLSGLNGGCCVEKVDSIGFGNLAAAELACCCCMEAKAAADPAAAELAFCCCCCMEAKAAADPAAAELACCC